MPTVIDELVTILGIELEPKTQAKLNSFSSLLKKTTAFAIGLGTALTAAAGTASVLAQQSALAGHEMKKFSDLTGISTDQLQEWEYAMVSSGGSAEAMRSDMEGLLESISSPIPGEFNHALFMMGVNSKTAQGEVRKVGDVLFDISEKMKRYSPQQQMVWGKQLGLSKDTIRLLKEGKEGIKEYLAAAKESGAVMSKEQIEKSHKFIKLLETTKRVMTLVRRELATALLPVMSKNIEKVSEWIKLNREWIGLKIADITEGVTEGFKKFWQMIDKVMSYFRQFLPGVNNLADSLLTVQNISSAVQVAFIAMAAAAASTAIAWLPLIAGAAAFFLIIEDIIAFTEGRESYTGDFVKGFRKFLDDFNQKFPELSGVFLEFFGLVKDVAVIIAKLAAEGLGELVSDARTLADILNPLITNLVKLVELSIPEDLKGFIKDVRSKIGGGEGGLDINPMESIGRSLPFLGPLMMIKDAMKLAGQTAPSYGGGGSVGGSSVVNHNTITIPVSGVGQPHQVADRILGGVGNTIAVASGG